MVLDYPLTLAPRWAPVVVNSIKNHTNNKHDVCGANDNQATKTKCMEQL